MPSRWKRPLQRAMVRVEQYRARAMSSHGQPSAINSRTTETVSTAVSTEANRRFTFGGGAVHRWRAHVQIGGTVLFYAFYSSAVLLLLGLVVDAPTPVTETVTLAAASVVGGFCRFLVLRCWVFGTSEAPTRPAAPEPGTVDAWDERA